MDLFENLNNDNLEYDVTPVDIGSWVSYMPYHDEKQLELQKDNLIKLPLNNSYGQISFIFSKQHGGSFLIISCIPSMYFLAYSPSLPILSKCFTAFSIIEEKSFP